MSPHRRLPRPVDGPAAFREATGVPALQRGWERVWRNGGGAGGDGVTVEAFAAVAGPRIAGLSQALRDGSYRPKPLRRLDIPKAAGGRRHLAIPAVTDRIAQTAVAQVLGPALDAEMEEGSFGYRPGRGVADAVARVEALRREGYVWTLDADIDDFFDTIPIDGLMARFARSVTQGPLTELVGLWLESGAAAAGRGIAQGSPLSPLLANLYLDDLDEAMGEKGVRIVRYADDFLVLARDKPTAEAAHARAVTLLARHGLALDPDKTRLRGYDEALRFLGRVFVRGWAIDAPDESAAEPEALLRRVAEDDRRAAQAGADAEEAEQAAGRAGLDRGLRLLYLHEPGRRLTLRNLSFAVHEAPVPGGDPPRELVAIHPDGLDRIELGPRVAVDPEALRHALAHAIPVAFTDGLGTAYGQCAPVLAPRAGRHLAQARHALDPALRLDLARRLVAGRIANQRALLRRVNHRRGLPLVADTAARLGAILRKVEAASAIDGLMGIEGEAAKLYWRAFGALLLNGFAFGPRRRRAAQDPVNIALDVTAGLLIRDVGAILLSTGLHPGFGILHATADGRDACVYDLVEEFRAGLAESVVLAAINTGGLTQAMAAAQPDGSIRLAAAGMRVLVRAYEDRAERPVISRRSGHRVTWRRLMREQAQAYAAHVEGVAPYDPFRLDH